MHRRCCWPPESASAESCSRSFTSSQRAAPRRLSSTALVERRPARGQTVQAHAVGDVVVDRLGERVRLLEHHPDRPPQRDHVDVRAVDVLAVDQHLAGDARAGNGVVHPVQRAQERALAAPGRSDERGHQIGAELRGDVEERLLRSVEERHAVDVDGHGMGVDRRPHDAVCGTTGTRGAGRGSVAGAGVMVSAPMGSTVPVCSRSSRRVARRASTRTEQDERDEDQRAGPGLTVPVLVGRDGVGEDLNGERRDRLVEPRREEPVVERGEQQRRGLAGDARQRQQDAGDDAGRRGRQHDASASPSRASRRAPAPPRAARPAPA